MKFTKHSVKVLNSTFIVSCIYLLILLTEENEKIVVAIFNDISRRHNRNSASLVDYETVISIFAKTTTVANTLNSPYSTMKWSLHSVFKRLPIDLNM